MKKITINDNQIKIVKIKNQDYICLTDMAKSAGHERALHSWLRTKNTITFLGLWEQINNKNFEIHEFVYFKNNAGINSFNPSVMEWIKKTNAKGILSKRGRYGGTYAHKDIAFEFGTWLSPKFKLLIITEFQRLKEEENKAKNLDWSARRMLTKINYKIHTDSIKKHLIPKLLNTNKIRHTYANEADILNLALFNMTAKEWRDKNPSLSGNIRDHTNIIQLVCLANLESLNAEFIRQGLSQGNRLKRLNQIAIIQMSSLLSTTVNASI